MKRKHEDGGDAGQNSNKIVFDSEGKPQQPQQNGKKRKTANGHANGIQHSKGNSGQNGSTSGSTTNPFIAKARALLKDRKELPIFPAKDRLIQEVAANDVLIIIGETGSGKTTQIPQFLHEAGYTKKGIVAVTQPRKVAAVSIAKRVSEELGTKLGDKVGYSIRFEDVTSQATRIKYMTDGMLLRELLSDNMLRKYSVIILDEAHERTLRTDILFGMVKAIRKKRPELKIIIMSATLNADRFSTYFNNAKVLYVKGRQFPVRTFHVAEKQEDYVDAAIVSTYQVHVEQPPGDILVFLTGQEEIETMEKILNENASELPPEAPKMLVCTMFAQMPTHQQAKVFERAPPGTRKVILSTNISETSITISGVRYVIDTGMAKVRGFNSKIGMEALKVQPISKASALQRAGRAGREAPGMCFRLYSEEGFKALADEAEAEIKRINLSSVLLLLKASGVDDVVNFDYMESPDRGSIIRALEQLYALKALGDDGKLSDLGRQMAEFPLDPPFSKVLLQSKSLNCTKDVISIVAMLSVDSIFFTPSEERGKFPSTIKKFTNYDGDHLTLLNVMKAFESVNGNKDWCREHYIQIRAMKQVMDIRQQIIRLCEKLGILSQGESLSSSSSAFANGESSIETGEQILKCFLAGFFQNAAIRQPDGSYKTLMSGQVAHIHPSSVLFSRKPQAVFFNELVLTTRQYMRNVSGIQPAWLIAAAPHYNGRVQT